MNCRQWVVDVILEQTPSRWWLEKQLSVASGQFRPLGCQCRL